MTDRIDFRPLADGRREDRIVGNAMQAIREKALQPADLWTGIASLAAPALVLAAMIVAVTFIRGGTLAPPTQTIEALVRPPAARLTGLGPSPAPAALLAVLEGM